MPENRGIIVDTGKFSAHYYLKFEFPEEFIVKCESMLSEFNGNLLRITFKAERVADPNQQPEVPEADSVAEAAEVA